MTKPTAAPGADSGSSSTTASARASGRPSAGPADVAEATAASGTAGSAAVTGGSEPAGPAAQGAGDLPHAPYPDDERADVPVGTPQTAGDELPDARSLWILAFTFAVVGLFFPLSGLIAIGCGALAWRRGSGRGKVATFVAIATTLIGITLTVVVLAT